LDSEIVHQIADVASLPRMPASRLRLPLDVETNARAPLGPGHGRLAEIMASRHQVRGEPRVVHLEQRVAGVEDESPDGRAARHDGEFTAPESSRRSRSPALRWVGPSFGSCGEDDALASLRGCRMTRPSGK